MKRSPIILVKLSRKQHEIEKNWTEWDEDSVRSMGAPFKFQIFVFDGRIATGENPNVLKLFYTI